MPDTDTTKQKKKKSFGFDDILSILENKKTRPLARPALHPTGEGGLHPDTAHSAKTNDPSQVSSALPEDSPLMIRLLSDIDQKNAEIMRLNNELIQARYDLQDKNFKVHSLTTEIAGKDLRIKELDVAVDGLNAEIHLLKKSAAANPAQPEAQTCPSVPQSAQDPESFQTTTTQMVDDATKAAETTQVIPAEQPNTQVLQANETGARPIREDYKIKEDLAEDDVATIFKRLVNDREEIPVTENEVPKRPRSAKLYDL